MMTPTLTFDFTSGSLSPLISFSRALNTATVVNSSGFITSANADSPRFDYNPVTFAANGLLIEESRTNLLTYSSDFSQNPPWSANAIAANPAVGVVSPSGSSDGNEITESATTAVHSFQRDTAITADTIYTTTVYAKAKSTGLQRYLRMQSGNTANTNIFRAVFDLVNGTISTAITAVGAASNAFASIKPAGNGWYRCQTTGKLDASSTTLRQIFYLQSVGNSFTASYAGDGASGLYWWGAQLEAGAFATSYIPTTSAALTRNADVAVMTGTNFSDWWQAGKGGVLVRARPGTVSGVRPWVQFDDGTANEIIALRGNTTNPELYIVDGGVAQAQIDAGTIAANTDYSLTGWWATNDCKARLDSGAVVTDTSATIPTVTQARLGSDGTNYLNGHLSSISYYDSFSEQIYTRRKNKAVFNLM